MFDPFANEASSVVLGWQDQPSTRGTSDIITSCLITLTLCLWTALHLNIPRHKESKCTQLLRKVWLLALGLVAPEVIAYTAWYQHRAAHRLSATVNLKLQQQPARTWFEKSLRFLTCGLRKPRSESDGPTYELEGQHANSTKAKRRHAWSAVHGFYANMGGFAFDTASVDIPFLPGSRQRLTLTPVGLAYLLDHEPNLIPDISREHIWDKSKASGLVKFLVCLQALWFISTIIVRFAQQLAVSLLELNVAGHAICALVIYSLWWNKPLDITEPTILSGDMAHEICAFMCMRSSTRRCPPELPEGIKYGEHRSFAENAWLPAKVKIPWYIWLFLTPLIILTPVIMPFYIISEALKTMGFMGPKGIRAMPRCRLEWSGERSFSEASPRVIDTDPAVRGNIGTERQKSKNTTIGKGGSYPVDLKYPILPPGGDHLSRESPQSSRTEEEAADERMRSSTSRHVESHAFETTKTLQGFCLRLGFRDRSGKFQTRQDGPDFAPMFIDLSTEDVERWRLSARAIRSHCTYSRWQERNDQGDHLDFPAKQSVCDSMSNWPTESPLNVVDEPQKEFVRVYIGFAIAGLLYGGLHLLAWNATFSSEGEQDFWRFSGLVLASSGPAGGILYGLYWAFSKLRIQTKIELLQDKLRRNIGQLFSSFLLVIYTLSVGLAGLIYALARIYLLVESCIQLGYLPRSAFTVPDWSKYYPHIM